MEEIKDQLEAESLLKKHGVLVGARGAGELMLHSARLGLVNVMNFFRQSVPTDFANKFGDTALHYAAKGGHKEIVQDMLDSGLSPLAKNLFGETPLFYAAEEGHKDVVEILAKYGSVEVQDKFGDTALHFAAREGHEETCIVLLQHNRLVINVLNENNQTALAYALEMGHLDLAKTLERYGGRVYVS